MSYLASRVFVVGTNQLSIYNIIILLYGLQNPISRATNLTR